MRSQDRVIAVTKAMAWVAYEDPFPVLACEAMVEGLTQHGLILGDPLPDGSPQFRRLRDRVMPPAELIWFWRSTAQQYAPEVAEAILRCASELEGALMGGPAPALGVSGEC